MKMQKKSWITLVAVLVTILALVATIIILYNIEPDDGKVTLVEEGLVEGPWTYDLYSDKTAVITAYDPAKEEGDPKNVTVPKKLGRAKVTALGTMEEKDNEVGKDGVFYNNETLRTVTVPDTVKTLGITTFSGCKNLEKVTLPEGLTAIGNSAFYLCYSLKTISLPQTLTQIDGSAFSFCKALTGISFPAGVTTLSAATFEGCEALSIANLPGITLVESGAFKSCKSLEEVTLSQAVTEFGVRAFKDCVKLKTVSYGGGERLSFEEEAFKGCTALQEFTIPKTAYKIFSTAFLGCTSLATIRYEAKSCDIAMGEAEDAPEAPFTQCPVTSIVFAKEVQRVPAYMFYGCKTLSSLALPEGLLSIGAFAFNGCTGLTEITIPETTMEIHPRAFGDCTGITKVNFLAKGCVTVYDEEYNSKLDDVVGGPFYGCTSLTTLSLGAAVKEISNNFMRDCEQLATVTFAKEPETVGERAFQYTPWLAAQTEEYVVLGKTLLKYNGDGKNVSLPVDLERINASAFMNCTGLTAIALPASLRAIGDRAFMNCTGLTAITLPTILDTLGRGAFAGCSGLTEITLPREITTVKENAFRDCSALTKVTFSDKTTTIENDAFAGCSGLLSVSFPATLTSIGERAFVGCHSLGLTVIPVGVTSIGEYAFSGAALEIILKPGLEAFTNSCFGGTWGTEEETIIYYEGNSTLYAEGLGKTVDKIPQAKVIPYLATEPKGDGTFWHYDENQRPVLWEKTN